MSNNKAHRLSDLQHYADDIVAEHNIPAISLAVWQGGQLRQGASGILNLETGVKATTDSIFQIGSITKVMTASLIMQLVDEEKLNLDKPIKHYLPDFGIADPKASEQITVRQLLNHTSGMAGDFFPDDQGQQGNLIARYVDRCALLPSVHPVGEMFSYSNSAYCVAGRLIEVVRGTSWYQAMNEGIFKPLGMTHAIADPADVIYHRAAIGHVPTGKAPGSADAWAIARPAYLSLGLAPAGASVTMSAADLITFARAHMAAGQNSKGERWLSQSAIQMMQTAHIDLPVSSPLNQNHMGLGWMINNFHQDSRCVYWHSGGTDGSLSMLQIIPEANIAFAVLMNGLDNATMATVNRTLLADLTGLMLNEPDEPSSDQTLEQQQWVCGQYESMYTTMQVARQGEHLSLTLSHKIEPLPPEHYQLRHVEENRFAMYTDEGKRGATLVFLHRDDGGAPQYLFDGGRLNTRV